MIEEGDRGFCSSTLWVSTRKAACGTYTRTAIFLMQREPGARACLDYWRRKVWRERNENRKVALCGFVHVEEVSSFSNLPWGRLEKSTISTLAVPNSNTRTSIRSTPDLSTSSCSVPLPRRRVHAGVTILSSNCPHASRPFLTGAVIRCRVIFVRRGEETAQETTAAYSACISPPAHSKGGRRQELAGWQGGEKRVRWRCGWSG